MVQPNQLALGTQAPGFRQLIVSAHVRLVVQRSNRVGDSAADESSAFTNDRACRWTAAQPRLRPRAAASRRALPRRRSRSVAGRETTGSLGLSRRGSAFCCELVRRTRPRRCMPRGSDLRHGALLSGQRAAAPVGARCRVMRRRPTGPKATRTNVRPASASSSW
jgi:hypothetical protein